jgi:hypothetical protein
VNTPHNRDIQILRRQALWFREFARLGDRADRDEIEALAKSIESQAEEAWDRFAETTTRH